MWVMWLIVGVIVVIIVIYMINSYSSTSKTLGDKISGLDYQINGKLHILSNQTTDLQNGKEAYFTLYQNGISLLQGSNSIEIPWGAIYEVKSQPYDSVANQEKSLIGRAAIGGLLFGDIGAIIGGMSGIGSKQIQIGGDLFLISFNYGNYGKTVLGIHVNNGLSKFLGKLNDLMKKDQRNIPETIKSEIYKIGEYNATQIIQNSETDCFHEILYDKTKEEFIIEIDSRNAGFKLHLNEIQKDNLIGLLNKSIEWKNKAKEAQLTAEKEVGKLESTITLEFNNTLHTVPNGISTVKFNSSFEDYDPTIDEDDSYFYNIFLFTPDINITDEDICLPHALIMVNEKNIKSILDSLSIENIENKINDEETRKNLVDDLLN